MRLGDTSGERSQVQAGLQPGDRVVVKGSFFLRAERERLGLRPSSDSAPPSDKTCATEVMFSSLKLTRPLPLNTPVVIE